jgi:hypothetical protein
MVFRSHLIGACCVRSGRLQGFIPQKLAHFEEHILTLHTVRDSQDRQDFTQLERWRGIHQLHIQHVEKCIAGASPFLSIRHWTTCRVGSQYACDAVTCSAQVLQVTPQIYISKVSTLDKFMVLGFYQRYPVVWSARSGFCSGTLATEQVQTARRQELANNDELV